MRSDGQSMMHASPLIFEWDGEGFKPIRRHAKECDARFVIGERYVLDEIQERSAASHKQYFASIRDSWMLLPEHMAEQFPTPDHLRKYALIRAGFRDERSIAASSKAEALRIAAFIRPMDEFAIVTVHGSIVTVYTAKSQSMRAMGKAQFQASKQSVLDFIASLIEVEPETLTANAGMAA